MLKKATEADTRRTRGTRLRILFVAHDSQLQGAQLALLNILRNLDRSLFVPFVVSPKTGPFTEEIARMGIPVATGLVMRWVFRLTPVSFMAALSAPWKLIRTPAIIALFIGGLPVRLGRLLLFLRRHQIDLVYTNTITVADGAIAAKFARRPHIWHLHENIDATEGLLKLLPGKHVASFLTPKLSTLIAVASRTLGDQIFADHLSMPKVNVIHNGVDTNRFSPNPSTNFLHRELGIPVDAPLVGICGTIQESKGHEVFIKAAADVSRKLPTSHFVIIGEGLPSYIRHITNLANDYGLTGRLHFTGWRTDIPEIFQELAIIVIASKQEAFGLTAIEGMSTGKPIVATRCGGPEEVIEHGKTGYLVELDNQIELAQRISELLSNPALGRRMGSAGRNKVEECFTVELCMEKIERMVLASVSK
jgi:glycosyltransferase involved in cell wall biosynthesis